MSQRVKVKKVSLVWVILDTCMELAGKIMSKHLLSKLTVACHIVNAVYMFENTIESVIYS